MNEFYLNELLEIKNGRDHKHLGDGPIPVLGSGGLMRYADKAMYDKASILLPRKGTLSNIQYIDRPFWTVDTLYYTVINQSKANPYFLFHYLKKMDLSKLNSGTGVPSMTFGAYYGIKVSLPSLETQHKIAAVLSALDDKIELNNQINAELEAMAKTLYDYWFVQFDFPFGSAQGKSAVVSAGSTTGDSDAEPVNWDAEPVNSDVEPVNSDAEPVEATGIASSASATRGYKSSGGKMVYNEVLKREIPEGWEVSVFNDWIDKTKTGDWGKEEMEGNYTERVHCVRGADINGLNGKGEVKAPVRYILKNNLSKALQPNDFIVEISGGSPVQSTGRIALLSNESFQRFDSHVICSNFCKAVSLKDESYVFNFKNEWQRLYDAGVFFGYEGKTSGIKNFLFDSFMDSYHIVKPPKELAQKYHQFVETLEKKKQLNLLQNRELVQLRDWLLPMLMNGQVTVGDAEEMGMVAEEKAEYQNPDLY